MFSNIGGKIKGFATILFVLGVIGGFIGAIWMGVVMDDVSDSGFVAFLTFLFVLAVTIVASYVSSMFMYGFGELIENSDRIKRNTEETYNMMSRGTVPSTAYAAPVSHGTAPTTAHTAPINHGTIPATSTDGWTCKSCGMKNGPSAVYCKSCGEGR